MVGTPATCDPRLFLTQFAAGDALDGFLKSDSNETIPPSVLKDFFNGHPIRFPNGKILFPVGVGKVKNYQGDGARRLRDVFLYAKKTKDVATSAQEDGATYQYCTTYFNAGNKDAEKAFQWIFIPTDVKGKTTDPARIAEAAKVFNSSFSEMVTRLLSCEDKFDYYAFGCQAAFERTPTLFAMLLRGMGCSTSNSVFIADMLLGRNDIPLETREAIVDQTPVTPELQKRLQEEFFTGP